MPRTVKEWVGKHDDAMPPASVRQRIYEREKGICHICGGKIDPGQRWEANHDPPLKDGGENRESEIFPAHAKCHRRLTAKQAAERAPIERKKQKHSGARRPKRKMQGRKFETTDKPRKIDKAAIAKASVQGPPAFARQIVRNDG